MTSPKLLYSRFLYKARVVELSIEVYVQKFYKLGLRVLFLIKITRLMRKMSGHVQRVGNNMISETSLKYSPLERRKLRNESIFALVTETKTSITSLHRKP